MINESAVKKLGFRNNQDAIGKDLSWVNPDEVLKKGRVIGVLKDFNITPLKNAVKPLVMHYRPSRFQYLYIRLRQEGVAATIPAIQRYFEQTYTHQSFGYSFLDETLNHLYNNEERLATIFSCFAVLAIIIACLGVMGLSLYSIQQRLKEVGIRKVLGASVLEVVTELVKNYVKPVWIASLIATPVAWWLIHQWLANFAYHVAISWIIFFVVSLSVLFLAVATIGIQSIRAASANPVKVLRSE